ncbi:hypothetical protein HS088_TW21G00939 [Tripterygium wilfordii]|uniref:Uncharacterized protein n=1 Tax=Tripterygium wilfordii TaxID=458696 RepID=A0A7J7C4U5_TRIWF|nr:hypothetical protein HS088_TW21G00939 [Tripterygium wilfordii]
MEIGDWRWRPVIGDDRRSGLLHKPRSSSSNQKFMPNLRIHLATQLTKISPDSSVLSLDDADGTGLLLALLGSLVGRVGFGYQVGRSAWLKVERLERSLGT